MRVRIDPSHPDASDYYEFSEGRVYLVLGIETGDLRILGDTGRPFLYPQELFEFVDRSVPEDWLVRDDTPGKEEMGPEAFLEVGFYEDFFDGDQKVKEKVFAYLERLRAEGSDTEG